MEQTKEAIVQEKLIRIQKEVIGHPTFQTRLINDVSRHVTQIKRTRMVSYKPMYIGFR